MPPAVYLHDLSPFLFRFGDGFGLRWYGLAYVAAFLVGYWLYRRLARKGYADLPEAAVGDFIAWWVVLGTIIGGRLGYMVLYQWPAFAANPLDFFKVWEGGMSAHGGMIGLVVATFLYSWVHRVSWLNLGDNLVVVAPLGLFFGRMANFINGELYGNPTAVSWAVQFPKELYSHPALAGQAMQEAAQRIPGSATLEQLVEGVRHSSQIREILTDVLTPRHPSQLYEAFLEGGLLFLLLWLLRTRFVVPNGFLTGVFFIGYAFLRSAAEVFREPDAGLIGGLTRGQFFSIFLALIGLAFLVYSLLRPTFPLGSQKKDQPRKSTSAGSSSPR